MALYRSTFGVPPPWEVWQAPVRMIAAVEGDDVVGLGTWAAHPEPRDPGIGRLLRCLHPWMRSSLDLPESDEKGLFIEAPEGLEVEEGRADWHLTALAVLPTHRRRGIGTLLALERLRLAREAGATQVFVQCIEGSGSRSLYEGLGFTPLVRLARHYPDGRGMTLLYRRLAC